VKPMIPAFAAAEFVWPHVPCSPTKEPI
jgi:hypothetical protein